MGETRDRILDATRELCVEHGFGALTMRRVAERVGVSAPAIYRHFEGKGALIHALLDDARSLFTQYLVVALEARTPRERFLRASERYLEFGLRDPNAYELVFMSSNQFGLFGVPSTVEEWQVSPPSTFQFLVDRVAECIEAGDFRKDDPTQVALSVFAVAHGMVALWLCGRFGDDEARFRAVYASAMERHMKGIAA